MFLVIKPTDDVLIRFFSGFGIAGGPPLVLLLSAFAVVFFPPAGICPIPRSNTSIEIAGGDLRCWNASISAASWASLFLIATVVMLPTLRRHRSVAMAEPMHSSIWRYCADWSKRHGCLANLFAFTIGSLGGTGIVGLWVVREHQRGNMAMPVRLALSRIWMSVRLASVAALVGIVACIALLTLDSSDSGAPSNRAARDQLHWAIASYAAALVTYAVQTPSVRAFIHGWLNRIAMAGEAGRAAGVAAMVGKLDPHTVLTLSRRHFRGLPFGRLTRTHLEPSSDAAALRSLSRRIPLGSCDAFMSHSWHDPADDKWAALTEWAASFHVAWAREPILWFDRCCIDQQKIEEQLACLPVWLSGCRTLLVLAGSTYTQRLWCVIECFTFLRMGGTSDIERLTLVPLRGLRAHEIRESFRAFDVRRAQCSVEETTQLLLSVVESGFGDLQVFNSLVRAIFVERVLNEDEGKPDQGQHVTADERSFLRRASASKASRSASPSAARRLNERKVRSMVSSAGTHVV